MKLSTFTYSDNNRSAVPNITIKNPDRTLVIMFGPSHLLDKPAPFNRSSLRTREPRPSGALVPGKFSGRISRTTHWSSASFNLIPQRSA